MRTDTEKKIKFIKSLIDAGRLDWAQRAADKLGTTRQAIHALTRRHIGGHPNEHSVRPAMSREAKKAITMLRAEFKKGTRNWAETVSTASGLTISQVKALAIGHMKEEYEDHLKHGIERRHAKVIKLWNRGVASETIAEKLGIEKKSVYATVNSVRKVRGPEMVASRY